MELFISHLWRNPRFFFAAALIVFFSISCHEYVHALVALKYGDDTASSRGHLTLNPLRQMGLWPIVLFCLIGIAWGQVPVDLHKLRGRFAAAAVAVAGPLTNLMLGLLFLAGCWYCVCFSNHEFAAYMLYYGGILNFVLFFLNILPLPGLDGGMIWFTLFPRLTGKSERFRGFLFFMLLVLFFCIRYLFDLAEICAQAFFTVLENLRS